MKYILLASAVFLFINACAQSAPPKTVEARATAAGLKLLKISDIHFNKADDHSLNVFDPKIRRKTDRFLHIYVKLK